MAWRDRIALVVLFALTGLPIGATVCAMACDSASTQAMAHHGTDRECAEQSRSSSAPRLSGASEHDCSAHAATMRQVATTAAEKAGLSAGFAFALVYPASHGELVPLRNDSFDCGAPPGTAPSTVRPLALRV